MTTLALFDSNEKPVVAAPRETERTMLDRLRRRYGKTYKNGSYVGRQYVIAEHVATTPGGSHDSARIADAIVLDTWSAPHSEITETERERREWRERCSIHGFEVKVSRSDWLTELADPEKAEAWAKHCHYFWLVASDRSIVRDDLPAGWGLLVPHGVSLRVAVKPVRRDPTPMPFSRIVSIARAVQKTEVAMATPAPAEEPKEKRADPESHVSEEAWCEHYMPGAACRYCAPKPDVSAFDAAIEKVAATAAEMIDTALATCVWLIDDGDGEHEEERPHDFSGDGLTCVNCGAAQPDAAEETDQ